VATPTANDLITRAFRRGRIIGREEVPGDDEASDALAELNDLLDEWWNDKLAVFRINVEQFALVANQQSYTMGAAGNFNTTRPLKLVPGCKFTIGNGVDRQLTVLTERAQWDAIPYKGTVAPPEFIFYDPAFPVANVLFYPTPDQAYPVYLNSWQRLQNLAALNTQIALPPGYNRLIINGLAVALCPEYGLEAPDSVKKAFARTYRLLSLVNYEMPILSMPPALLPSIAGRPNIISGDTV
jgi:hypothetical protein